MYKLFLAVVSMLAAAGFVIASPVADPQGAGLPLIGSLPLVGSIFGGGAAPASADPDATGSTGSTGSTGGAAPAAAAGGGTDPLSGLLGALAI